MLTQSCALQDALERHRTEHSSAVYMAGVSAAADTIAAVAAAGADRKESQLYLDALEQPLLECLGGLCRQLHCALVDDRKADVAASACCFCSVLRMCANMKYHIDKQASCRSDDKGWHSCTGIIPQCPSKAC